MAITPSIVATRTSGVAPLGIVFDASGTTADGVTYPFHELLYRWTFGDAGLGTWTYSGQSKNVEWGPIAGHVFETAGVFTVTLQVWDISGNYATTTEEITVTAADTQWAGSATYCFSTSGDFTGAPADCPTENKITTSDWTEVVAEAANGKRLLLRRGETWEAAAQKVMTYSGPGMFGAFGTGAKPVISWTGGSPDELFWTSGSSDWRYVDLAIEGGATTLKVFANGGTVCTNLLLLRIDCHETANLTVQTGAVAFDNAGTMIVDCSVDTIAGGNGSLGIFWEGSCNAVLGCSVSDSITYSSEHLMRFMCLQRSIVAHNYYELCKSDKVHLTLRAPLWGTEGDFYNEYTEKVVLRANKFSVTGSGNPNPMAIGPNATGLDHRIRDVIVEDNYAYGVSSRPGAALQMMINGGTDRFTMRNNIIQLENPDGACHGLVHSADGAEPLDTVWCYGNSMYLLVGTGYASRGIWFASDMSNGYAYNNVLISNAASPDVVLNQGTGGAEGNNHQSQSDPGWATFPPTLAEHFALSLGSALIDAGYTVPALLDHAGKSRIGLTYDIGAYEYGASDPAPSGVGTRLVLVRRN